MEYLRTLLTETKQLQGNQDLVLPVTNAMNILRAYYKILSENSGKQTESERSQMKSTYLLTVKHYKQQIRVLVNVIHCDR